MSRLKTCPLVFLNNIRKHRAQRLAANDTTTERFFDRVSDKGFQAPQRLAVDPLYHTQENILRQHDRANWRGVHQDIQVFTAYFARRLRRMNIPIYAHSALRTRDEQLALQKEGRSQVSGKDAPHVKGIAVDLVHSRYHWMLTRQEWDFLGKVGKDTAHKLGIPIQWGGDWSFYDPAHWQLPSATPSALIEDGPPLHYTPTALYKRYPAR